MPWTTPETFTAGQTLTAASMNAISGNLNALPRVLSAGALSGSSIAIASAASYSAIQIVLLLRSDVAAATNDFAWIRFNGDTGNNYDSVYSIMSATALTSAEQRAQNNARLGYVPATNAPASNFGTFRVMIPNPGATTAFKNGEVTGGFAQNTTASNMFSVSSFIQWRDTSAISSFVIGSAGAGSWVTGSTYTVIGYPAP